MNLNGGGEWESNPPIATGLRHTGFEDQESHQTLCASGRTIAQVSNVGLQRRVQLLSLIHWPVDTFSLLSFAAFPPTLSL
jgi:hypothetical protein